MTAQELTTLLQQPRGLQAISYEQLENLLVEYPYCGVVRLLLLKKCQMQAHPAFQQQLQLAAVYLPDRVRLHDFLKTQFDDADDPAVGIIPPFPIPDGFPELNNEDEAKKKTDNVIIPLEEIPNKSKKKRFKLPRIPVLEDKAVLEVLSGSHIELLPPPPKKADKKPKKEKEGVRGLFNFAPDIEQFFKDLARKRPASDSPQDFLGIDEWAQRSLQENEEVASETLAALLAQQGQKEKAIKMYEVLRLKFPQKNAIFARKIRTLKK